MHKWQIYDDLVYQYLENRNAYVLDPEKNVQSLDAIGLQNRLLMDHSNHRSLFLGLK